MVEFNLCLGIKHAINISFKEYKFNKLLVQHKKVNLLDFLSKKNIFVSSIRYFWPLSGTSTTWYASQVFIWATEYYPQSYGDDQICGISYLSQPIQSQCFERATKALPPHIGLAKWIKIIHLKKIDKYIL